MSRKRGTMFVFSLAILCIAVVGYYLYVSSFVKQWNNKIYPKAMINGIDVSGETKDRAISLVKESNKAVENKKVIVKIPDNKSYTLDFEESKPKFNIEETVLKAYSYGRDGSSFTKYKMIKNSSPRNYELTFSYEEGAIKNFLDNLEKEINSEPKDAVLNMEKPGVFLISNEVKGRKLKREELEKEIASMINSKENIEVIAKIDETLPTVTAVALAQVNSLISSFTTSFKSSAAGRAANIVLATKSVNRTLLMPGDTFSFNKIVGERTAQRGYQEAPIIIKNKLENGQGGGVCQVSTTLYNSILRANIRSLVRANHTLTLSYVQPGFDATVSESIDYKFKNTLPYPLYIEGYTRNGIIGFNIYSNSSLNKIKYNLINEVYERTEPETIYKDDLNLPEGITEQEQKPIAGCRVKVYLVGKENGKEISKQLISNDKYNVVNEIIRRGTKK